MNLPTATLRSVNRGHDPRGVLSALPHLVASVEPAVVFTSLAGLSVPILSDSCFVVIEEQGRLAYRIEAPGGEPDERSAPLPGPAAGWSGQLVDERNVTTPIVAHPFAGEPHYHGIVTHTWTNGHRPTPTDAALAQVVVERAVSTVHQERLAACLDQQRRENASLQRALAANRAIGAAIGIVMSDYRIAYTHAFDLLQRVSRHSHRALRDLAAEVVLTGTLPV